MTVGLSTVAKVGSSFLANQSASAGNRETVGQAFAPATPRYDILEAYYNNTVYRRSDTHITEIQNWQGLPKELRPLVSAPRTAVDWWVAHVYRNGLIPWDTEATDQAMIDAFAVSLVWGGWESRDLLQYVLYGANLGDVFAEVEVSDRRQKVYPRLHHPKYIVDLELNATRDVISYQLCIPDYDWQRKEQYEWGKVVTQTEIVTLYDGHEHGYDDMPARIENPYGFVPGVWVNHMPAGDGFHGASCLEGILTLVDELNGLRASVNDFIHRFAKQPYMVSTSEADKLLKLLGKSRTNARDDQSVSDFARSRANNNQRDSTNLIPLPPGSSVEAMIANLGLAEAIPHLQALEDAINQAVPEITIDRELRGMDYVSDPGARMLVGDGEHRLNAGAASYDFGIIRLAQMVSAIGGEIRKTGRWKDNTRAQELFRNFDLSSYDKGLLDGAIKDRELIDPSMTELANEAMVVESIGTDWGRRHAGLSDEEITDLAAGRAEQTTGLDSLLGRAFAGAPAFEPAAIGAPA